LRMPGPDAGSGREKDAFMRPGNDNGTCTCTFGRRDVHADSRDRPEKVQRGPGAATTPRNARVRSAARAEALTRVGDESQRRGLGGEGLEAT
jgi:hypothetical protein